MTVSGFPPEETTHLVKVMRERQGSRVRVFGGGEEASGLFEAIDGKCAVIHIEEVRPGLAPPGIVLHFCVPWIKGGKTEFVVQKLTELGVASISVFSSRREVVKSSESKLDRMRRIAVEACKQCERSDVPSLYEFPDLASAISRAELPPHQTLLLYERERETLFSDTVRHALQTETRREIIIASGPEGGFDAAELDSVLPTATRVGFGPRILRAETAPIAAAAAVLALTGDV